VVSLNGEWQDTPDTPIFAQFAGSATATDPPTDPPGCNDAPAATSTLSFSGSGATGFGSPYPGTIFYAGTITIGQQDQVSAAGASSVWGYSSYTVHYGNVTGFTGTFRVENPPGTTTVQGTLTGLAPYQGKNIATCYGAASPAFDRPTSGNLAAMNADARAYFTATVGANDTATGTAVLHQYQACENLNPGGVNCTRNNGAFGLADPTETLTVTKAGTGTGYVYSNPGGLDCGPTCVQDYPINTNVQLFASADAGSVFTGWTGACTGSASECDVTMAAAKAVTATFDDANAPNTIIDQKPAANTKSRSATFAFHSTVAGSTFFCQRDANPSVSCTSPRTFSNLTDGSHTFTVYAKNANGTPDPSPATFTWKVDNVVPTATINFPGTGTLGRGDWDVYTPCAPAGVCGTATDGTGTGLAPVRLTIAQNTASGIMYWNGTKFATAQTNLTATGRDAWAYTFPFANFPANGNYKVCVTPRDQAVNVGAQTCKQFTIDKAKGGYFLPKDVTDRSQSTATLLADGRVLFAAGFDHNGAMNTTDIYDPATGTVTPTGPLPGQGANRGLATRLGNGKVLLVLPAGDSYLYTPASSTWLATSSPTDAHGDGLLVSLPSGKALLAGGLDATGQTKLNTSELYDPATDTWSAAGVMKARRWMPSSVIAGGKVYVFGGINAANAWLKTVEVYTPATKSWALVAPMSVVRPESTATVLSGGKILVAGGDNTTNGTRLATAEVYTTSSNTWANVGSMHTGRSAHSATLLSSGKVLVAGGVDTSAGLKSAEIFDPAAGTWAVTGPLSAARFSHTATLLSSGRVLIRGGGPVTPGAELYVP
jgi:hypothetical protein